MRVRRFKKGDRVLVRLYRRPATVISIEPNNGDLIVRIDGFDTGDQRVGMDDVEHVCVVERLAELDDGA